MIDSLVSRLDALNGALYTYVLVGLLLLGGAWLTIATRGVQLRHIGTMLRTSLGSRRGDEGGISSFQAFAIGMATRIGIGNITGVALALVLGGPGAIFWMWIVAAVGMATAFAEATLAQIFKVRWPDGTFRGGPAYYLTVGLRSRAWGALFAVLLVVTMVVAMPMVQANTIALAVEGGHGVPTWVTGLVLMALTALVAFAGVRGVARVAEVLTPLMAVGYVAIAITVVALDIGRFPQFLGDIFAGAFGLRPGLAGVAGGMAAALLNGAQRGLFTNEAGMGTNPNAAATATVAHPVQQGFIQSLGVFVDSMLVCTATAFIILAPGTGNFVPGVTGPDAAAHLTVDAVTGRLGDVMAWPMTIMIFFFGFSSILGAFAYAAVAADFLATRARPHHVLATVAVLATGVGALQKLTTVWVVMDTTMALITVTNLVGVLALTRWVVGALRDYEAQRREGIAEPRFVGTTNPLLPGPVPGDVWTPEYAGRH